jgi:hypothetical protein
MEFVARASLEPSIPVEVAEPTTKEPPWILKEKKVEPIAHKTTCTRSTHHTRTGALLDNGTREGGT